MNCGSTATMKTMPLGLVALVSAPVRTRWRRRITGGPACAPPSSSVTGARHCLKPSHSRYAAPSSLTTMNAPAEATSTAPTPAPATSRMKASPICKPSTVADAPRTP